MAGLDPYKPNEVPGPLGFDCLSCKRPVKVVTRGQAMCVICPDCQAGHDLTVSPFRIAVNFPKTAFELSIPLGATGKLKGIVWAVVAAAKCREEADYSWMEFTLFNPEHGYAYLSEFNGHWNYIRPVQLALGKPYVERVTRWKDREYRLFHAYKSRMIYGVGEFTNFPSTRNRTKVEEYISPPYMLIREETENEVQWLHAEYTRADEIAAAFGRESVPCADSSDIFSNQPYLARIDQATLLRFSLVLVGLMLLAQFLYMIAVPHTQVFFERYYYKDSLVQSPLVTPSFDMGGPSGVELNFKCPVNNSWAYADVVLVNDATHEEYAFGIGTEFYSGVEDGESWSEGSTENAQFISSIPSGRYHMEIAPSRGTTGGYTPSYFEVSLHSGVTVWSNFLLTTLVLAFFPAAILWQKNIFERRRWMNSDYSPYYSQEEEE